MTPVAAQWLNLPPGNRTSFGGMLVLALLPEKVKNYRYLYNYILRPLKDVGEEKGTGFKVKVEGHHREYTKFIEISWIVQDTRGLHPLLGCKQSPAVIGGCYMCRVEGHRHYGAGPNGNKATTVYPGAVTTVSRGGSERDRQLRQRYEEAFTKNDKLKQLAWAPKARAITTKEALESAHRVETARTKTDKERAAKTEVYKEKDALTDTFGEAFDKVKRTGCDPAHAIAHLSIELLCLILNSGSMVCKPAKIKYEQEELGRFLDIKVNETTCSSVPWHATKQSVLAMTELLAQQALRVPKDWPSVSECLAAPKKMKLAEAIALCGPIGCYVVDKLDLDPDYRKIFVDTLRAASPLLLKVQPDMTRQQEAQRSLERALAELEIKLPLFWCSVTRHWLLHIIPKCRLFGSVWAWNMLPWERLHVLLKGLARGKRNMVSSFRIWYDLFDQAQTDWRPRYDQWTLECNRSSISAERWIVYNTGSVKVLGRMVPGIIDDPMMSMVQDLWTILNKEFDKLRDRYRTDVARRKKRKRNAVSIEMKDWRPSRSNLNALTEDELKWLTMDHNVQVPD